MAYTSQLPKFLLAVDTETSGVSRVGADPSLGYQIVSIGALIIDSVTFETVDQLYLELKHDSKFKWEDGAERVHGLSREYLDANGMTMEEAAIELLSLVSKWMGPGSSVVAVGHRIHFDQYFINSMLSEAGFELQWDRVVIDSAALAGALLNLTGSDFLFEAVGLPERQLHNALEDICYTVEAIKFMKNVFIDGLGVRSS